MNMSTIYFRGQKLKKRPKSIFTLSYIITDQLYYTILYYRCMHGRDNGKKTKSQFARVYLSLSYLTAMPWTKVFIKYEIYILYILLETLVSNICRFVFYPMYRFPDLHIICLISEGIHFKNESLIFYTTYNITKCIKKLD